MDYEKAYKEALERAKQFANKELYAECNGHLVEYIFPELKESEDERIRKELIRLFQSDTPQQFGEFTNKQFIAWLEKQGEKPIGYIHTIDKDGNYTKEPILSNSSNNGKPAWSEEDDEMLDNVIKTLHKHSAGDEDYLDKYYWLIALKDRVQPKQEWNEEDEMMIEDTIYFLDTAKKHYASTVELDACIDWLKSLRPQSHWRPTEEQMYILKWVSDVFLKQDSVVEKSAADVLGSLYEQLKAL